MNRPILVRLLLSLVLLFSQQMATLHALEHLGGALAASSAQVAGGDGALADADSEASELAKAVAQHQNCHQCLAFAHLAAPLAGSMRSFAAPDLVAQAARQPTPDLHHLDSIWARHARAPPHA